MPTILTTAADRAKTPRRRKTSENRQKTIVLAVRVTPTEHLNILSRVGRTRTTADYLRSLLFADLGWARSEHQDRNQLAQSVLGHGDDLTEREARVLAILRGEVSL